MLSIQIKNSKFVFAKLVMILIDRSFDLFKNESSVYLIIRLMLSLLIALKMIQLSGGQFSRRVTTILIFCNYLSRLHT